MAPNAAISTLERILLATSLNMALSPSPVEPAARAEVQKRLT